MHRSQQVVDFFLVDEQFAVSRYPELVAPLDSHTREKLVDVGVDDRGQEHEIAGAAGDTLRQPHQAWQRTGSLYDCEFYGTPEGVGRLDGNDEVEALVQDAREGMRGIQGQRTEDGHQFAAEVTLDPGFLFRRPHLPAQEADALVGQLGYQLFIEYAVLVEHQLVGAGADGCLVASDGNLQRYAAVELSGPVVDTNGAGDNLAVGFLVARYLDRVPLAQAVWRAQVAARWICSQRGDEKHPPTRERLAQLARSAD